MKRTLKEILIGFLEIIFDSTNSQIGCCIFIAFLGLALLIIPMADGEKPILMIVISIILIVISILIIRNRVKRILEEEKKKKL